MTELKIPVESASDKRVAMDEASKPNGIRSLGITIGPSLLLDVVFAVSSAISLADLLCRSGRRASPLMRMIAALGTLAPWIYLFLARRWVLHWGASDAEVNAPLPGDEIIPEPAWQSTRAVQIAAPAEAVWPWLAQMGQDRGGLYSYDWLENLAGLQFHNADRIVPEWQDVRVADVVRFAPDHDTLVVTGVEPNQSLVWRVLNPSTHQVADGSSGRIWVDATWSFVLRRIDERHSRLIQRFRFGIRPRVLGALYTALMEIPHFLMERRMLLGIRERAERAFATSGALGRTAITTQ